MLAPVPTAVPPKATFSSSFFADTIPSRATVNAVVYDANSLPNVTCQNPHPYLIESFAMIKRSAAIANMRTKTLDRKRGNAIVKACDKILAGKYQDQFVNSG